MDFLEGGNWQREPSMNYRCSTRWEVQWEHLPIWEENIEGLPDRWVKIIEMKTRDYYGWADSGRRIMKPEVHCVKEGLWVW